MTERMPTTDTELDARRKDRSRRLCVELFGKGEVKVAHEVMAPGVISHLEGATETTGEGTIIRQALLLRRAMPDLAVTCDDQVVEGDRVTTHWSATGTHTGALILPGSTVEPTGHRLTVRETRVDRYDGDTIVESWLISRRYSSSPQAELFL
jgi:predicted ester cyclase